MEGAHVSAGTRGPCAMGECAGTGSFMDLEAQGLKHGQWAYLGRRCPQARCGHSPSRRSRSSGSSRPRWRSCRGQGEGREGHLAPPAQRPVPDPCPLSTASRCPRCRKGQDRTRSHRRDSGHLRLSVGPGGTEGAKERNLDTEATGRGTPLTDLSTTDVADGGDC